uniref:Uncharacterized protein n=1 Tax=Rhizophora mucronata TaxID=61149 RepID=A0A2P2Q9B1_RHIMU
MIVSLHDFLTVSKSTSTLEVYNYLLTLVFMSAKA